MITHNKYYRLQALFFLLTIILSSDFISAQPTCSSCLPNSQPCSTPNTITSEFSVGCITPTDGWGYILIFGDDFNAGTIDLSKWVTSKQTSSYGSSDPTDPNFAISFDNGVNNMVFNYPGLTIETKSVPTFDSVVVGYDTSVTRAYNFTSANLISGYGFPSNSRVLMNEFPNPQYGIYTITCTLPSNLIKDPYQATSGGYAGSGSIWPSFWMVGNGAGTDYGEIDGFEFSHRSNQDYQTNHAPIQTNACETTVDPNSIDFGNGYSHTHTLIYTPDEIDWWIDNIPTRVDAKYFYAYRVLGIFPPSALYPFLCDNLPPTPPDIQYQNNVFPDVPMLLTFGNGAAVGADPSVFPTNFNISSVKL
jgi:hypothetical protein